MSQSTPTSTLDNLAHLASKPGVQSTLVLSRSDGFIIHKTGLLARSPAVESNGDTSLPANGDSSFQEAQAHNEISAESVAYKVFTFVSQAQGFAEGIDAADEVRLLRLRTRRSEIVIVPDSKFLLVVIHDAPQSQ